MKSLTRTLRNLKHFSFLKFVSSLDHSVNKKENMKISRSRQFVYALLATTTTTIKCETIYIYYDIRAVVEMGEWIYLFKKENLYLSFVCSVQETCLFISSFCFNIGRGKEDLFKYYLKFYSH